MIAQPEDSAEPVTIARVYDRLRTLARGYLAAEAPGHTLQATALVNEAILRVHEDAQSAAPTCDSLVAKTALAMRHVLIDHARRKHAQKRSSGGERVPLDDSLLAYECRVGDLLALGEALERLAEFDPLAARIVDLRFFGMMTREESAQAIGVSRATADRLWRFARLWLCSELRNEDRHVDS